MMQSDTESPSAIEDRCTETSSIYSTNFQEIKNVGNGAFGNVFIVQKKFDNLFYAVKKIKLSAVDEERKIEMRECEIMSCLDHENVVKYYHHWVETFVGTALSDTSASIGNSESNSSNYMYSDGNRRYKEYNDYGNSSDSVQFMETDESYKKDFNNFTSGDNVAEKFFDSNFEIDKNNNKKSNGESAIKSILYIQMELYEKDLRSTIDSVINRNDKTVWTIFKQILTGLSYIHGKGVVHRDLKPENIFLDSNNCVKIGDFGLANFAFKESNVLKNLTPEVGTELYAAPEILSSYCVKVDMYSLGIIFFELSVPPFETKMEKYKVMQDIRDPEIKIPDSFKLFLDKTTETLLRVLLVHDPNERPAAAELLKIFNLNF